MPFHEAIAADYTISYEFDAGGVNDWGKAECNFAVPRKIASRRTKLSASVSFAGADHNNMTVKVASEDEELDRCYFASGAGEVRRNVSNSPIRLHLYAKRKTRSECFLNQPYGILYLQFLDLK